MADFLYPFLHIIFTEGPLTCGNSLFDIARRFSFADCKQGNFF